MATQDFIYISTFYDHIFKVYLNTNSKTLYSEEVCNHISRALGFKTQSFFMFALYLPTKNIFLPPSFNLVNSNNDLKLDHLNVKIYYRLRFLPASIPQLMENDSSAFNYLFHQTRHDFINSCIPNINLLKLSDSLGLVVADVCRMTLNQSSNNFNETSIDSTQKDSLKKLPLLHDDLANVPISNSFNHLLRTKLKSSALLLNHLETYVPNDYLNSARDRIRFAVSGRRALRKAVKESLLAPKMPSKFFYEMKYLETLLPLPAYNNESYDCSISGHALLQMSRDVTRPPFADQSTMERTVANSCVPGRIGLNLPTPPIAHGSLNRKESKYEYCLMFQPLASALRSGASLRRHHRVGHKRKSLRKQNFVLNPKKASSQNKSILRPTNDTKNICEKNGILICALCELSFISIHSETVAEISRKTGIPLTVTFNTNLAMLSFISLLDGYYRLSQRFSFNLCTLVYSPTLLKLKSLASHGPVGDEFVELKFREKLQQAMAQSDCQIKSLTGSYILRQSAYSYNRFLLDVLLIENREDQSRYKANSGKFQDQTAHHDIQYRIQTFVIQENFDEEPIQLLNSTENATSVIKTNESDFKNPSSPQNKMIKALLQIPQQSNSYWTFLGEKLDTDKILPSQQQQKPLQYANLRALLKAYSSSGGERVPFTYPTKCIPPSDYDLAPELLLCNRYLFDLSEKTNHRTKSLTFNSDERLAQYATLQIALKQILDPAGLIGNNWFSAGNSLKHSGKPNGNENEFEPQNTNQSHKNTLVDCDNYQQYQLIKAAPLLFIAFTDLELPFSSCHDNKHKQKFYNNPQQYLVEMEPPITFQKTAHLNDKTDKVLETQSTNPDLNNKVEYHDVLSSEEMYNSLSSRPTINRTPNLFSGQTLMTKNSRLIQGEFNASNTLNGRSSLMAGGIWHKDKYHKIPISFKTIITSYYTSNNKSSPIDSEEMATVTFLKALNKFAFISDPTLVKIYGVCLDPLLIVTEELELGSWATFLRSSAAVKEERIDVCCILEAGATISRALWFLHEKALIHNRIGAVNVYVKLKNRTPTEPNHKFEDNCHQDLERAFPENWTVKLCDPVLSINPFEAYYTNIASQPTTNLSKGFESLDEGLNKLYAICPHHALFKLPWLSPELFYCTQNDGGSASKHNQYLTDKLPSLLKDSIINKQINPISISDSISNDEGYDIWSFGTFLWESLMYASVNPLSALCLSGSSQLSIKSAYRNLLKSLQKTTEENSFIIPKDNPGVSNDVVDISLSGTEINGLKSVVFETKIEKEANLLLSLLLSNIMHHEVRLPKPANCPDRLYSLLLQCWQRDKDHRIRIHELVRDTHQIFYSLLHTREKRKQFSQLQLQTNKSQHSDNQTNFPYPTSEKAFVKSNTISNGQISQPSNVRVSQHVRINHHRFSSNSKSHMPNANKSEHKTLDSAVSALEPLNANFLLKSTPTSPFKNQFAEIGIGSDGYVDHETLKSPLPTFHECRRDNNESLYVPTDVESEYSITLNKDINDADKPNEIIVNSNASNKPTRNNFNDTLKRRPFDPHSLQYDMCFKNTNSSNNDINNIIHESEPKRHVENEEKNSFSTNLPLVNGHINSMTMNNLVSVVVEEEKRLKKDSFELKSHITQLPLPPLPQKQSPSPAPCLKKQRPRFSRSNKIWRQFKQHILSTLLKRHGCQRDTSSPQKKVLMASDGKSYIRLLPQNASSPSSTLGDIKETTKPKWLLRKKFRFRSNSYSGLTSIGHPHSQTYLLGNSNYSNNPYYYSYNNFGNCSFKHVPMIPFLTTAITSNDSHSNGLRRSSSSYTISFSINNHQNDKNSANAFTISETQIRYIKSLGEMNKNGDDTWLACWTKFNDLFRQKVVIKQFNLQQSPSFVNNINNDNREITFLKSQEVQKNYALISPLFEVILPKLILNPHPNIAHIKGILSCNDENDVFQSDSYKKDERMPISYTSRNNMFNNTLVRIKQKYVMEYLEMGTLSNYLQMNGPDITLRQKMIYMKDIARGMAFLYDELGIVHGDLKACHILMTNEGKTVKIAHFGRKCRNAINSNDYIDKSNKGQPNDENDIVLSDLCWMAPELFKDTNAITTKSDVWSFGSVCWEILTNSTITLSQAMFSITQNSHEMQNLKSSRTLNDKPRHSYINEEIFTLPQTKSKIISQYYNESINGSDQNNPKLQPALPISNNEQVIVLMEQLIKDGWRLPIPEFCPSYLGEYIKDTLWTFNQHSRPFFHQILQKFSLLLQPNI